MDSGKTILITGATAGIGYETALALAKTGARILIVGRSKDKVEFAVRGIAEQTSSQSLSGYVMDLSSQKQIREGSRRILHESGTIDVLVNNAGAWISRHSVTEEGVEMQLATNHLAPFLLSHLLLPALKSSVDPRIINVSSDAHFHGKIHFDDLNLSKKYHGLRAYAQSKLANVLFTYEFERRKPAGSPAIYAVQPGLVKTGIGLKHTKSLHDLAWRIRRLAGVSPAEGAATSVYLATSEECRGISGKYWDRCRVKATSEDSYNEHDAQKLWEISERLCGIESYF